MHKTGLIYNKRSKMHRNTNPIITKKLLVKAYMKAQSAMEYLMTYGWAILIIAVVLGALFQLGVFNGNNFASKAPPGSCQVFRPNGPYTTSFINLEGECQGELPEYVAQFNGQSSAIDISLPQNVFPANTPMTVAMWINYKSVIGAGAGCGANQIDLLDLSGIWKFYLGFGTAPNGPTPLTFWLESWGASPPFELYNNVWYFVAGVYYPQNQTHVVYVDSGSGSSSNPPTTAITGGVIGGSDGCGGTLNGSIANVQIYNASLSKLDLQTLYQEGIGGAPIDLQHLVAWWPLNGNANDYSGNGNNGQINGGVTFVSNWWSGYTPP